MDSGGVSFKEDRIRKITKLYYSRPEIQKALFEFSKNREICPRYFEGFGKRPDIFEYPGDIFELVKKGATSFNCSEELWDDPLKIETGMNEKQLNEQRIGWDLVIDIDCKYIDFSKKATQAILNVLKSHSLKNYGVKFSVSGDTPILIRENEDISLHPILEVIEKLKKNKKIEVLSLDKNRNLKFSKIYDFLEHKDTLYEIVHSQNKIPLKATGHHSVFAWNKGEIIQKKVTELKKGDFLISYNSKKNPFSEKNLIIENNFEFSKNQHSKKLISNRIEITKELMRLIGYFLAEGHVTNVINQVGFSFNKNEIKYIEDVKFLLNSITGKKISIRHPNEGSIQILIHSKEWASFFDTFCGKKKEKHVPPFAFKLPKELFQELLLGYIRGDGYKKGEYGIVVKSVSKKLITDFIWLCKLNNISCSISFEQGKEHFLPQGNLFKGSLVYLLMIPKSELEIAEFNRKRNKFSPYARDRTFPIDGLKEVYNQIKPKMFNSHRTEQMTLKKKNANLIRIKKVLEWFDKFKEKEYNNNSKIILKNYKKLFNSDISIVEIEKIDKKDKEIVYDVSVEETESFFGNYYPVLLHNSGNKGFHIIIPWKAFPKEIAGENTKNLFPDLPRKILAYVRFKAEEEMRNLVSEEELETFKETKIKRGIKCNTCKEIAQEYELVDYFCPKCSRRESKKIFDGQKKEIKCPDCRTMFRIKQSSKIYECKKCNISSIKNPNNFSRHIEIDLFDLMGLDLILISPRHLFRMPYSLHESSALASIVLDEEELEKFDLKDANPFNIKIKEFIPKSKENEANILIREALDWAKQNQIDSGETKETLKGKYADFKPIKLDFIKEEDFPPCVKNILKGISDGKKRALFALINLFRSVGMDKEEMEKRIYEWNKKNEVPLRDGYISTQLLWAYKKKPILPPNCKEFYQGMGVCQPDNSCFSIKNPVNYLVRKSYNQNKSVKKKVNL